MHSETLIIRPVILCGGAGTRLWPVSRQSFPKQLLPITGEQSLLQQTAGRLSGKQFASALIVSSEDQRFFVKRQLQNAGVPIEAILLEPEGRNTAAAAALAACWIDAQGRDELLLLMPSDHVIGDQEAFVAAIQTGAARAAQGSIVTFGIKPSEPNTQYGYIEADDRTTSPDGVFPIARFVEKPNAETAADYLRSGRFFWNAGIFLVKASTLLDELRQHLPETLDAVAQSIAEAGVDDLFVRAAAKSFALAPNISIDHAVMEKTARGVVLPVQMNWSDVGSWDAVWNLGKKDGANNLTHGEVVAVDTVNSLLRSDDGPLVATIGLDKVVVIAVRDAVLVAPMDRMADLKSLVEQVKEHDGDRVAAPPKVVRPWGSYETINQGPQFQVKHIVVDPGETLSLQMHHHRSEHWVVVRGSAEVTVGDEVRNLQENESTYIPVGTKHRLANRGKVPLELVEVQCGAYLGEDDIVRFEDVYGRVEK